MGAILGKGFPEGTPNLRMSEEKNVSLRSDAVLSDDEQSEEESRENPQKRSLAADMLPRVVRDEFALMVYVDQRPTQTMCSFTTPAGFLRAAFFTK